MRVGIANVSGYAGAELARLLSGHPEAEIVQVTGRSAAGQRLAEIFPHLAAIDMPIDAELDKQIDVAFLALPHAASAAAALPLLERGVKVIDISADFRLRDAAEYEEWYKQVHPAPELLEEAVFGLPEAYAEEIKGARLVANPGCYPTSSILALSPMMQHIGPDIIIDSKSGVSGAGRSLGQMYHFSEADENTQAYGLAGHRHMPEIRQELRRARDRQAPERHNEALRLTFVPHLIPMVRGILTTAYADLLTPMNREAVVEIYREYYRDAEFTRVVPTPPATKQTAGSNNCFIYPTVDPRTNRLIVISCLDNLIKGAAGQAIQNMNLMFGLPQGTGLSAIAVYP